MLFPSFISSNSHTLQIITSSPLPTSHCWGRSDPVGPGDLGEKGPGQAGQVKLPVVGPGPGPGGSLLQPLLHPAPVGCGGEAQGEGARPQGGAGEKEREVEGAGRGREAREEAQQPVALPQHPQDVAVDGGAEQPAGVPLHQVALVLQPLHQGGQLPNPGHPRRHPRPQARLAPAHKPPVSQLGRSEYGINSCAPTHLSAAVATWSAM